MKKIICYLLILCILSSLFACSNSNENPQGSGKHEEHTYQIWNGPNCQIPKTCGICGYTEGELGDHSTDFGNCFYCNEFQNRELYESIKNKIFEAELKVSVAYELVKEYKDSDDIKLKAAIDTVNPDVENSITKIESIISLCGDIEALDVVKSSLEFAVIYAPDYYDTTSRTLLDAYYKDLEDYAELISLAYEFMVELETL